ncbi:MAG TPA: hypothetical protein DDX91_01490 [Ruminococcaceae bacterium]|nr:hypothetical protein [Oscillospiraceae bacterium]
MQKNRIIPFGYCVINGKYALNICESEAVQKIFSDYIGGKSLKTIAAEMQIPYNANKTAWNKNMVSRVLENKKYIGENGYPKIVTQHEFEQAAQIKAERTTYRNPVLQTNPQRINTITITEYEPTDEIQRMTNEINRLLDSETSDKENIEALIIKCAQLKYSAIKEVVT